MPFVHFNTKQIVYKTLANKKGFANTTSFCILLLHFAKNHIVISCFGHKREAPQKKRSSFVAATRSHSSSGHLRKPEYSTESIDAYGFGPSLQAHHHQGHRDIHKPYNCVHASKWFSCAINDAWFCRAVEHNFFAKQISIMSYCLSSDFWILLSPNTCSIVCVCVCV